MNQILDREHFIARVEFAGQEAERWKKHHAEALAALPAGTTVIIDLSTGDYVTGETWDAAEDAFEQKFGKIERFSHVYTVDRPIFVGGGLWLK